MTITTLLTLSVLLNVLLLGYIFFKLKSVHHRSFSLPTETIIPLDNAIKQIKAFREQYGDQPKCSLIEYDELMNYLEYEKREVEAAGKQISGISFNYALNLETVEGRYIRDKINLVFFPTIWTTAEVDGQQVEGHWSYDPKSDMLIRDILTKGVPKMNKKGFGFGLMPFDKVTKGGNQLGQSPPLQGGD